MPEKTNKAGLNGSKIAVLLILGFVNAIMYCFPYVRYVFYDQQIANNEDYERTVWYIDVSIFTSYAFSNDPGRNSCR